jgi:hypothetical protein
VAVIRLRPEPLDISVYAGDSLTARLVFTKSGVPVPLTGMTFFSQIKHAATDLAPEELVLVAISTEPDEEHVLIVTVAAEQTNALIRLPSSELAIDTVSRRQVVRWSGVWDLQATYSDARVRTLVAGTFQVDLDVSRVVA